MAPRALSACRSTACSSCFCAWSSARSTQRSPSSCRPSRACAVPYSSARLGESASSVPLRAPRYATTSACCPAAASCRALSTTSDDVGIVCVPRLPGNRVLAEVRQRAGERLVRKRLDCRDPPPRTVRAFAIPQPQQLAFDVGVGLVHHAIAVEVAVGTAVRELQLGRGAEQQAGRLERDCDIVW